MAAWLAVLAISTLLAPDTLPHTVRFLSRVVQGLLLAWIAYDLVDTASRWRIAVRALAVTGLVVAAWALPKPRTVKTAVYDVTGSAEPAALSTLL